MKRSRRSRRSGGWVMIFVLAMLLLLSLLVAGFFAQSQDAVAMTRVSMGQQVAMSHAEYGAQEAVRALRAMQVNTSTIAQACTDADVAANTCPAVILSSLIDNGKTKELGATGGLQYQYVIYRRASMDTAQPPNRYVVRSTGYYGYTMTSNALVTSIIEVEVDVGKGTNYACTGGYECQ
jgi:Tfp pilus assembly protein PilX